MNIRLVRNVALAGAAVTLAGLVTAPPASAAGDAPATHRDFDQDNFSDPTKVDNPWTPLVPGTQFVFEGTADRGPGAQPHRVVYTVTDLTKVINGVESIVMWDVDINDGVVVEAELAFEAQDDDGNVWNMGEYPEEYENGKLLGAPSTWIPGQQGAKAGLLMRAGPRLNTSSYRQGLSQKIDFGDVAYVYARHDEVCVIAGCYDRVIEIDESDSFDPDDAHQRKFYSKGTGNIRIAPTEGDPEQETLELVEVRVLSPQERAEANAEAKRLDRRAYRVAPHPYKQTPPAT